MTYFSQKKIEFPLSDAYNFALACRREMKRGFPKRDPLTTSIRTFILYVEYEKIIRKKSILSVAFIFEFCRHADLLQELRRVSPFT